MIRLYNGNAFEFLQSYNGPKFDAIITDPPYSSGGASMADRQKTTAEKYTGTKRSCPYPDFAGDSMDQRSWGNYMRMVLEAARAQCNPGAAICLFIDWRQLPTLTDAMQWAGWSWRGIAVWDKMSSRPQKGRFRQQSEFILWGSNGAMPANRPVPVLPGVFRSPNVPAGQKYHQTQKPIDIMREIVKICIPSGHILDPFAGSGSTLLAAQDEGFETTGVEISTKIAQQAAVRLGVNIMKIGPNLRQK